MLQSFLLFILLFSSCIETGQLYMDPALNVAAKEVSYTHNGKEMKGYLAYPTKMKSKAPGILVVHEWWGQTEYPRERARMLAAHGYVAFAVDMYGKGQTASHPKKAGAFSKSVMKNASTVSGPFKAAMNTLQKQPQVRAGDIAAIGYCFGGSVVLEMARQGAELDLVASFHGGLITPSKAKNVKAKVLVFNGAADPFVKKQQIDTFQNEMKAANVDFEFKSYPGAVHGFTNPAATEKGRSLSLPLAYDRKADHDSWAKTISELSKAFNK